MTQPNTATASWQNFYLRMRGKLLGKDVPLMTDEHEFPPPSKEVETTHAALVTLLKMQELQVLFAFFRSEVERLNEGKISSDKSTEAQLRSAKAFEECLDWMAKAIVDFVAEYDQGKIAYANFLEQKMQREQGNIPPPPPLPL